MDQKDRITIAEFRTLIDEKLSKLPQDGRLSKLDFDMPGLFEGIDRCGFYVKYVTGDRKKCKTKLCNLDGSADDKPPNAIMISLNAGKVNLV